MKTVLDHGFVRLVDVMGDDLSVVRSARVSYNADWRSGKDANSDEKLIRYLWTNRHTTPFETVIFTFEVKAPIFVFRQWHRHRTWSYNEISARYAALPNERYVPKLEHIGQQSVKNKQARVIGGVIPLRYRVGRWLVMAHGWMSDRLYRLLLWAGWPRELARSVLPVSTYSRMFGTVNLLNLLKFLTLRCHPHAQYEIRVYAEAMLELIEQRVPSCVAAWKSEQAAAAENGATKRD